MITQNISSCAAEQEGLFTLFPDIPLIPAQAAAAVILSVKTELPAENRAAAETVFFLEIERFVTHPGFARRDVAAFV